MSGIGWPQWCVALLLAAGVHALALDAFVSTRPGTSDPGGGGVSLSLRHGVDQPGAVAAAAVPAPAEPSTAAAAEGAAAPNAAADEAGAVDTIAIPDLPAADLTRSAEQTTAGPILAERPVKKPDIPPAESELAAPPEPTHRDARTEPVGQGDATSTAQPLAAVNSLYNPGSFDAVGRTGERGSEGLDGVVRGYLLAVQSEFNRRKHYPHDAYRRGAQGTVQLRFVVARSGTVLSYEIDDSSGDPELDREVEALMRRVQPLPPFPAGLDRDRLELVLPVGFYLR